MMWAQTFGVARSALLKSLLKSRAEPQQVECMLLKQPHDAYMAVQLASWVPSDNAKSVNKWTMGSAGVESCASEGAVASGADPCREWDPLGAAVQPVRAAEG